MSTGFRLLFVNQHYWPDVAATGQYLTDLAEYLAVCGHDVTVLCSQGKYAGGGSLEAKAREERRGVEIVRLAGTGFGRMRRGGRLIDYVSFLTRALARMVRSRRYDLVVLLTTPSLLGVTGMLSRSLRGQRYAIWSMDIHPDIEERLGIIPKAGVSRIFHAIGDASYRKAEFVVVLGSCMREVLAQKGVPDDVMHTIPVWSRRDQVEPIPKAANPIVEDLGLRGRFVVMYSGNAGLAHRFREVFGAIDRMKNPAPEWVFVGDGPRKREILERVGGTVPNFRYLDYWPREMLKYSLSVGDVHLITMRDDMAGLVVPSKLYGIMAAGRPVVFVGPRRSETARTIEGEGIGRVIDPQEEGDDATERLVEALTDLRDRPDERRRLGVRAREVFLEKFERNVCCGQWEKLIRGAVQLSEL